MGGIILNDSRATSSIASEYRLVFRSHWFPERQRMNWPGIRFWKQPAARWRCFIIFRHQIPDIRILFFRIAVNSIYKHDPNYMWKDSPTENTMESLKCYSKVASKKGSLLSVCWNKRCRAHNIWNETYNRSHKFHFRKEKDNPSKPFTSTSI